MAFLDISCVTFRARREHHLCLAGLQVAVVDPRPTTRGELI